MIDVTTPDSPFYRLLSTKYAAEREAEALTILGQHPELATLSWPGPDQQGLPFVQGSTALHYAANDGKLLLMARLVELGADIDANGANWFRSVLSWAANGARVEAVEWLLARGEAPQALDAMHAAAWGGSRSGADPSKDYVGVMQRLLAAGADINDRDRSCSRRRI